MSLLVPAYPGCPGSKAVKRSLLLLLVDCNPLMTFVSRLVVQVVPVHCYAEVGKILTDIARRAVHLQ